MLKKMLVFAAVIMLILGILSSAMGYSIMYVYTSNGNSLNLRDAPSIYGNIMTTIPYGASVVVNDYYNSTWYSVTYNGYTGYAMSTYLVSSYSPCYTATPTCTPTPTPTPSISDVTFPNEIFYGFTTVYYEALVTPSNPAGYVNLRWAPSLEADIHSRYYANEVLIVMSQNSLWCQVLDEENNIMGYMMRQFLTPYYYGDS